MLGHNTNKTNRLIYFTPLGYKENSVSLCVLSFFSQNLESGILSS